MKSYIKNTLILSLCLILSKMIGAVYKIFLSNILGSQGIGIYQLIYPVYALVLVVITGGMPTYISQRVAYFRARGLKKEIAKLIKNCFVLCLCLGIAFASIIVVFGGQIAKIQGSSFAYLGYVIVGVSIVFSAISCVIKGYFVGIENVTPNAIGGIFENLCKFGFGLLFAYMLQDYGLAYSVAGACLGILISELVSFFYLLARYNKNKLKQESYVSYKAIKSIFFQFMPISLASIILPVSACIDSFLVVNLLAQTMAIRQATSLFGIATGMISPLVNFPVVLCSTIATAFLPALTYAIEQKRDTKEMIGGTYFSIWFFSLPCAIGLFILAPLVIQVCFPAIESSYVTIATMYLAISCFNIVLLSTIQVSCSLLNSINKFYLPFFCQLIGLLVKFSLFIPLVLFTNLGIISLSVSSLVSNVIICFLIVILDKKYFDMSFSHLKFFVPLLGCCAMAFVVLSLNRTFVFNKYIKLVSLVGIGAMIYFFVCVLFRAVKIQEIKNIFAKQNSNGDLT